MIIDAGERTPVNSLFQVWLEELHAEATVCNSRLESMLRDALESITEYPLPVYSGKDCAALKGFDKKLCIFMDRRLEVYNYNLSLVQSEDTEDTSDS